MAGRADTRMQASPLTARTLTAMLVLVPLVYWSSLRDYTLPPKLLVLQLGLAVALIAWFLSGPGSIRLPATAPPALAYLLFNAVSIFAATDPVAGLLELAKILSGVLLFLLVALRLRPEQLPALLVAWAATATAVSLLGIVQHLGWRPLHIPSAGLPSATLGFRNIAAMYLIQSLPFAAALFLLAKKRGVQVLALLAAALMSIFLVYTRTRGAWAGLAGSLLVVGGLLALTRPPKRDRTPGLKFKRAATAAALALVLALALLPSGLPKIGPQSVDEKKAGVGAAVASIFREGGGRGRLAMWQHTWEMALDRPLSGVGLGNWAVHYPRYDRGDRVQFERAPERPHNDLLCILSEIGLPGFLCYAWLGVAALLSAWSALRSADAQARWLSAACLASLLAIAGHSLFSFPRERVAPTFFFWLALGLLAVVSPVRKRSVAGGRAARALVGLACLLAILQLGLTRRLIRFESRMGRAVAAEQRGDWRRVALETGAALRAGPFHPEAVHLRGYALNGAGGFQESRRLYRDALARRPYDIQMLNGAGIAAQNLGLNDEAEAHYTRALEIVPRLPDVCFNLAGLYMKTGRIEEAVQTYRRTLELRPGDAEPHYALGELYARQGRLREAVDAYRSFLKNWQGDPRYAEAARRKIEQINAIQNP